MSFLELDNIKVQEPVPGYKGKFVHSENQTIAFWEVDEGAALPEHSHPHEQISTVVEGEFELTINGSTKKVNKNSVAVIPANIPHSGVALTKCKIIDVFYPVREEYK
ncbi:MAG TPA: cupin domain-containing protein [Ignavibacteria bacterium]|nr:cupin domain-containing protein [Ignavibacteria bacterium]